MTGGHRGWGAMANKDANPLKYLAMIAVNEVAVRGQDDKDADEGRKESPRFSGEPLKVIKKDSQFVKWNFMA